MQTTGHLVGVRVEFAARVKFHHDDFDRRAVLRLVHLDRDATAVVFDRARTVVVKDNIHQVAVTSQRFVNGIVHHFVHQVMQT